MRPPSFDRISAILNNFTDDAAGASWTLQDCIHALLESWVITHEDRLRIARAQTVTSDRLGVSVPNHYEVSAAFNAMANFLNALTDEHITALSITQRDVIHNFLTRSAERFKKKYPAAGGVDHER